MYNILKLNKIAAIGTDRLGENYNCVDECAAPDGILVRSASMHDMELPESLLAIARAGAGVNNIPLDKCAEKGICVFNTPGANANAVMELVVAGMLLASRKIAQGIAWNKTLADDENCLKTVEKGKSQFVGPEIKGKTLGVVGLGAIGVLVANAARALHMRVVGYDPYLSVDAALHLSRHVTIVKNIDEMYAQADYITYHLPLNDGTRGMINAETIGKMKDGVRILNFSRDGLVKSADIIAALESGKMAAYVTDFATQDLLTVDGVVAIPHLGASTPESEDNCAVMAADEIKDYLELGNIKNSVNFPNVSMPRSGETRFCVFHQNTPKIISQLLDIIGGNVENMENKSRGDYAYTIIDVTGANKGCDDALKAIDGVIRVREL
ncbi:3-phosphoglycerate dehydrogenase family protein [uncultured Ruminococcus sp.]|uniref:3-phosphoglycerate dehydrogenase family protein n=1 Tax=uncultured Ruminococcus sp. TaxID=165186 RepID=UPI002931D0DB|nr:3-phosphoglycerate dehydrogenase family protein [uncultured Ruminococcus sp.]